LKGAAALPPDAAVLIQAGFDDSCRELGKQAAVRAVRAVVVLFAGHVTSRRTPGDDMNKLKLQLDDLRVDSFDTTAGRREKGTIFGEQCTCYTNCTCPGCPTCDASCNGTCDASCNGTCDASCGGGATCGDRHTCAYDCTEFSCGGPEWTVCW
jgi:hypothetical protein